MCDDTYGRWTQLVYGVQTVWNHSFKAHKIFVREWQFHTEIKSIFRRAWQVSQHLACIKTWRQCSKLHNVLVVSTCYWLVLHLIINPSSSILPHQDTSRNIIDVKRCYKWKKKTLFDIMNMIITFRQKQLALPDRFTHGDLKDI